MQTCEISLKTVNVLSANECGGFSVVCMKEFGPQSQHTFSLALLNAPCKILADSKALALSRCRPPNGSIQNRHPQCMALQMHMWRQRTSLHMQPMPSCGNIACLDIANATAFTSMEKKNGQRCFCFLQQITRVKFWLWLVKFWSAGNSNDERGNVMPNEQLFYLLYLYPTFLRVACRFYYFIECRITIIKTIICSSHMRAPKEHNLNQRVIVKMYSEKKFAFLKKGTENRF